jgi:hypothetical protein
VVIGSLAASAAGCATARAADLVPDGPPLATPAPPPREIAPVEERAAVEAPPAAAPVETEPAEAATPARTPARQEPRAAETPPVAAQPAPEAEPPPRELRGVTSAAAAAEEQKVRDLMARATRDLNRVDYQRLTAEGKSQYDQSKSFSQQAEQALKERNIAYAMTAADKAATLAAGLAGR